MAGLQQFKARPFAGYNKQAVRPMMRLEIAKHSGKYVNYTGGRMGEMKYAKLDRVGKPLLLKFLDLQINSCSVNRKCGDRPPGDRRELALMDHDRAWRLLLSTGKARVGSCILACISLKSHFEPSTFML